MLPLNTKEELTWSSQYCSQMALNIRLRVKTMMAKKMTLAMNQPPLTCQIETGRVNKDTETGRYDTGRDKDKEKRRNNRGDDKDREK